MTETPYTAETHYRFGVQAAQADDLEAAASEFRAALSLEPNHAEAHYKLGWVLGSQGDIQQALAELRQAIRLRPDHIEAHHNLGALLLQKAQLDAGESGVMEIGLLEEAKAAFEAVLQVESYDQRAYALLSLVRKAIQRYGEDYPEKSENQTESEGHPPESLQE